MVNEKEPRWILDPKIGITEIEGDPNELCDSRIPGIKFIWETRKKELEGTEQLREFTERMAREWAIETGVIENVFNLDMSVTETLIEDGFQGDFISGSSTTNSSDDYIMQILRDHKSVLDSMYGIIKGNQKFSRFHIRSFHENLLKSQDTYKGVGPAGEVTETTLIKGGWKTLINYLERSGMRYYFCPPPQVDREIEKLIKMHLSHEKWSGEVQAAWLHHRFTQIHPFQDGNGRVARALASLALLKDGLFPLVVPRDQKTEYIDALDAADSGNLKPLIALITVLQTRQLRKVTTISRDISEVKRSKDDFAASLRELRERLGGRQHAEPAPSDEGYEKVHELAGLIENELYNRLREIQPEIEDALKSPSYGVATFVTRSKEKENEHYYRIQIVQNAKRIDYFADGRGYRSWITLKINSSSRAKLVFPIHGEGKVFKGALICVPFLEFKDGDGEGGSVPPSVLLTQGFTFYFTEEKEAVLKRFRSWRERVLTLAMKTLGNHF